MLDGRQVVFENVELEPMLQILAAWHVQHKGSCLSRSVLELDEKAQGSCAIAVKHIPFRFGVPGGGKSKRATHRKCDERLSYFNVFFVTRSSFYSVHIACALAVRQSITLVSLAFVLRI